MYKMFFCLLIATSVHSYPQQQNEIRKLQSLNIEHEEGNEQRQQYNNTTIAIVNNIAAETLNSTIFSVNATNEIEKPVDKNVQRSNGIGNSIENKKDAPTMSMKSGNEARQFNIPFVQSISMNNWFKNAKPSSIALIIRDNQPLRIWAIGSVSKFPPFIERFVQRIQSYYSTYKYHDLSRPASLQIINPQYHQNTTEEAFIEYDSNETTDENEEITTDTIYYDNDEYSTTETNDATATE